MEITYLTSKNKISAEALEAFVRSVDEDFVPRLEGRVNIAEWIQKVFKLAAVVAAVADGDIVGLLVFYDNDRLTSLGYIAYVAVSRKCRRQGVATELLNRCFTISREAGMKAVGIHTNSVEARRLYEKNGFCVQEEQFLSQYAVMRCYLKKTL